MARGDREKEERNERAKKAMAAMKAMGIGVQKAKPMLKRLLKEFDNSWEYIEADNYSVLVDALISIPESPQTEDPRKKDDVVAEPSEPTRKRGRVESDDEASPSANVAEATRERRQACEDDGSQQLQLRRRRLEPPAKIVASQASSIDRDADSLQPRHCEAEEALIARGSKVQEAIALVVEPQTTPVKDKPAATTPLVAHQPRTNSVKEQPASDSTSVIHQPRTSPMKEHPSGNAPLVAYQPQTNPVMETPAAISSLVTYRRDRRPMQDSLIAYRSQKAEIRNQPSAAVAPVQPKDEPLDNYDVSFEPPIAVIPPPKQIAAGNIAQRQCGLHGGISGNNGSTSTSETHVSEPQLLRQAENRNEKSLPNAPSGKDTAHQLADIQDTSAKHVEIASSTSGEVKISLTCSSDREGFEMPDLESVFKMVEDRCLKSYKILQPNFSLMNIMTELCQCVLEVSSKSTQENEDNVVHLIPMMDQLKSSGLHNALGGISEFSSHGSPLTIPRGSGMTVNTLMKDLNANGRGNGRMEIGNQESSNVNSAGMVVMDRQLQLANVRPVHDVNDITKGEERVRIPVVNEVSSEKFPSSFHYIPHNIVYQNGYISFSLARIGDEDCCADCFGDCMSSSIPCACARETGGEFAYTLEGLIKKEFLDECISMNRDPQKHRLFYCKDCPLERSKNEVKPDPCKGHLVRKFVKECWSKCGCNKQCGNRVVQRGITCNLQVFYTPEGKGWGLRTLDDLPRGAFVCEYVGEILTNMELYDRTIQTTSNARHTYPVLLDADWGSEGVLKDEEALCLDATFYGNVGRFVNHRCFDANLIEIPVEVETPDHHYYHLAFFTTRKVEAFEELTWDYGIDFDDHKHPIKAFRCCCGSKVCRDMKRRRPRSSAFILK